LICGVGGEWLGGFSKCIGNGIAYVADLWCVLLGLQLVYDKGLKVVEVCIDSEAVIKSIRNKETVSASGRGLVQRILQLLE
jgi:ribonuclease HI